MGILMWDFGPGSRPYKPREPKGEETRGEVSAGVSDPEQVPDLDDVSGGGATGSDDASRSVRQLPARSVRKGVPVRIVGVEADRIED